MGGVVKYKFMKKKPFSMNDRSLLIFTSNRSFLTNCICLAVIVCFLLSTKYICTVSFGPFLLHLQTELTTAHMDVLLLI